MFFVVVRTCLLYLSRITKIASTGAVRKKIAIFDRTYGAKGRVGGLKWEGGKQVSGIGDQGKGGMEK